jgi:uncharacterized protein YfaS (alpha-2-macroglobulin family)
MDRLREYLDAQAPDWKADVTGTLLAGSCAIMRMDEEAQELVDAYAFDEKAFAARGLFSALAVKALRTAVLAKHFPDRLQSGENDAQAMIDAALIALTGREYSTFSAAQSVRALMSVSSAAAASLDATRLLCVEGETGAAARFAAGGEMLSLDAPGCATFRVETEQRAVPLYWQVTTDGFDRTPPSVASTRRMEVERDYLDAGGRKVDSVNLGDQVTVSITARAHEWPQPDSVIVDLLPGGFEMVLAERGGDGGDGGDEEEDAGRAPFRVERREDRMLLFTDLQPGRPFTHTYAIRAVNKGRFTTPPVHAEAMYDQTARADGAAGSMEVK